MKIKNIIIPALMLSCVSLLGFSNNSESSFLKEDTNLELASKKLRLNTTQSSDVLVSNILKVQASSTSIKNGENVKSLRFVAGISDLNIAPFFQRAEIKVDDQVIMEQRDTYVSYAYSSIDNGGTNQTASKAFDSEDYKYFISYTLRDIPEQYWFTPISVTLKVDGSDTNVSKTVNVAALAEEYQNSTDYSYYKIDDNNVAIGLANTNLEEANIPEYYLEVEDTNTTLLGKRIRITSVGYYKVKDPNNIHFQSTSLKSINIPEGITTIDYYAFVSCNALTSISLPQSLKNVNGYAFFNTSSLEQIILPKNTILGGYVFGAHHENLKIYFEGDDISSWASATNNSWNDGLTDEKNQLFLYSEVEKAKPEGGYGYWHYDANNNPVAW